MVFNIEKQYDKFASDYAKVEFNPRKLTLSEIFISKIGNMRGMSALDLGCGDGFFSRLAKKLGAKFVLRIDISEKQINLAKFKSKKALLKIVYKKGDAFNIHLSKKFDVVIAGFTLSYANREEILQKALNVICQHLKSGGRLFAVVCNPSNPLRDKKILYRVIPVKNTALRDGSKLRCEFYNEKGNLFFYDYKFFWSKKTFNQLLRESGFKDIQWIKIKNKSRGIPSTLRLRSTNVILYAIKI